MKKLFIFISLILLIILSSCDIDDNNIEICDTDTLIEEKTNDNVNNEESKKDNVIDNEDESSKKENDTTEEKDNEEKSNNLEDYDSGEWKGQIH